MGSPDSVIASLEAKLVAFVSSLTDDEASLLSTMVGDPASPEVAGFDQAPGTPTPNAPLALPLLVSNVLKTRHDTAKNSISNVR